MWDLHFSLSENYHIELTHLFEYVIKIYRWYQRTSTERCIQHTVSRSCSRKVVAGRLFLSSWILYHQWDNTTDKCSKQQKHHVLILFKPLRPLLMRWWDMRKPPPSLSYEGFDKKKGCCFSKSCVFAGTWTQTIQRRYICSSHLGSLSWGGELTIPVQRNIDETYTPNLLHEGGAMHISSNTLSVANKLKALLVCWSNIKN